VNLAGYTSICRIRGWQPKWALFVRSAIATYMFIIVAICSQIFALFTCLDVPGGSVTLKYPSVRCWESAHSALVAPALVLLLVMVVLVPSGLFHALHRVHMNDTLQDLQVSER
jgi:fumarate reductase subunit D